MNLGTKEEENQLEWNMLQPATIEMCWDFLFRG